MSCPSVWRRWRLQFHATETTIEDMITSLIDATIEATIEAVIKATIEAISLLVRYPIGYLFYTTLV